MKRKQKKEDRCCGRIVLDTRFYRIGQCSRRAKYFVDGKGYCKTHHPDEVSKRREKSNALGENRWRTERLRIRGVYFAGVLEKIANGHKNPRKLASEALEGLEFPTETGS